MEMLGLLLAISLIEWYLIDKGRHELWGELSFHKWITIGVSLIASFCLVFTFGLDMIFAFGLVPEITFAGQVLTGFALSSGSSAISEIMGLITKK